MGKYDDRPYSVGKGKPPPEFRWGPGQSGNPGGPKRKANPAHTSTTEMLAAEMHELIAVTKVDNRGETRTRKTPARAVIVQRLIHDAISGSPAARFKATQLLLTMGAFDLPPEAQQASPEARNKAAEELVARLAAEYEAGNL